MNRIQFTRTSLIGAAAAGLVALTASAPAWAQAATYPQGTDCTSIQSSTNRTDCMNQMNEQRQNNDPGAVTPAPDGSNIDGSSTDGNNSVAPSTSPAPNNSAQPDSNGTNGTNSGSNNNGTNSNGSGGATQ